jgi:uncharacterized protein YutE (UPF0331/DUF86 family)
MKNGVFYLISVASIGIVILREIYPFLKFDGISLSLLAIAALAISLPRLIELLPPLKKAKFKGFEIEFEKDIEVLESKVKEISVEAEKTELEGSAKYPPLHSAYVDEYQTISFSNDANMLKVLKAAILTEKIIIQAAKDLDIEIKGNVKSPTVIIRALVNEGVVTEKERAVFTSFWDLRNKVVHGQLDGLTDGQTTRIMSLLWRLVTIFG